MSVVTSEFIHCWLDRYEHIALVNRRRMEALRELFQEFDQKGVEVLPLKGMDLLLRAYRGLGHRSMGDMDLLVKEEDLVKISTLLEKKGFFRQDHRRSFFTESFADEGVDYVSKDYGLDLDISWNVAYLDSPRSLWERRVLRETPLGPRLFLHPEDALLYLLAHPFTCRGRMRPYFLQDIEILLEKEGVHIDWQRWCQEVERRQLRVLIYYGLKYAREKGLTRILEEVFLSLRPRSAWDRCLVFFYTRMVTEENAPPDSYFLSLLRTPTRRGKLQLLRRAFFPPDRLIQFRRGKVPFWQRVLGGVLRPLRILVRSFYILPRDFLRVFQPPPLTRRTGEGRTAASI